MRPRSMIAMGATLCVSLWATAGCGATDGEREAGPSFAVSVAPLELEGIADVCYGVYVHNGDGELVAYRAGVCASRYGSGGALSYVIPCDATPTAAQSTVTLVLEGIDLEAGPSTRWLAQTEYINPCGWPEPTSDEDALGVVEGGWLPRPADPPYEGPGAGADVNWDGFACQRAVTCEPNRDAMVAFDLTVMRSAGQGFFDVAVELDDLFCSAKFDCEDEDGLPLNLLFDDEGRRAQSVVMGLACTGGPAADTHLYLSDVTITCDVGAPVVLSPSIGDGGNAWPAPHGAGEELVYQYAVYEGRERLAGLNKAYWNLAIGLDPATLGASGICTLTARATASDGPLSHGASPAGRVYPVISWTIPLNPSGGPTPGCGRVPLGAVGLTAGYLDPDDPPVCFSHALSVEWGAPDGAVVTAPVVPTDGPCATGPDLEPPPPPLAGWRSGGGTSLVRVLSPDLEALGAPNGFSGQTWSLAMDQDGEPVVAWGSNGTVRAARSQAGQWSEVGTPLTDPEGPSPSARGPTVAVDGAGEVVLAWQGNNSKIYVARSGPAGWTALGGGLMDPGANPAARSPVLATGPAGVPVLLWRANDSTIPVVRWDGSAWQWLGAPLTDPGFNPAPRYASLAVGPDGNPVVVINGNDGHLYVARWTGTDWGWLGGGLREPIANPAPYRASISVGASGTPIVGWAGNDGFVYVASWDGAAWQWLGGGFREPTPNPWARDPVVAYGAEPMVSWAGNDGGIHLARFSGGSWIQSTLAGPWSQGALLVAAPGQSARSWSFFD